MQVLTEKNTVLSQELEKCKAQLEAALAAAGEPKGTPSGKIHFERLVLCGLGANLTIHVADGAGLDPEKQQLLRRLKAGESPHVGEIERGEWCTRRQSVIVCSGGGV